MIKNLFKMESDTVCQQSVKIPFSFDNRENIPKGKEIGDCIVIRPITVATWFKLRPLLMQIEKEDMDKMLVEKDSINSDCIEVANKYAELLLDIVCIGIHNKATEPPQWFRQVLADNTTWEDIKILLNAIIYRIGYYPFYESITTLRRVSPISETEIIAAQKNIDTYKI